MQIDALKEEIAPFLRFSAIGGFFGSIDAESVYLYPKETPDVIIKSHLQTVEASVEYVLNDLSVRECRSSKSQNPLSQ